jgi:hypothetical protein
MIGQSAGIDDALLGTTKAPQNLNLSGGGAVVTNLSR